MEGMPLGWAAEPGLAATPALAHGWRSLQDAGHEPARPERRSILEPGTPWRLRGACDPENEQGPLYCVCFY